MLLFFVVEVLGPRDVSLDLACCANQSFLAGMAPPCVAWCLAREVVLVLIDPFVGTLNLPPSVELVMIANEVSSFG